MSNNRPSLRKSFRERFLTPTQARTRPTSPSSRSPTLKASTATTPKTTPTSSSSSLLPASTSPTNASSATLQRLFSAALKPLSNRDRELIQKYVPVSPAHIDIALDEVIQVAQAQQKQYRDKRWTFTLGGRTVTLQEEAEKLVRWLDRFKEVGDIVASVDPIHVGLPWAGVRLLLDVALKNADTRASILVGCELALYMSNRLKVYIDFHLRLPRTQAQGNFEVVLVKLYTCILSFLAQAIRVYQNSSARSLVRAFWSDDDIADFEMQCDKLAARAEVEASNCDRTLYQRFTQQVVDEMKKLYGLQKTLDRIETKIDLENLNRLPFAAGAEFNEYSTDHATCHPGTRLDILRQIKDWAEQPDGKRIFWLNGMAGTGKSTISRTVAKWSLDPAQRQKGIGLGASFFFKRGEGDRGTATRFFPTIIRQLATTVPTLAPLVAQAIGTEHNVYSPLFGGQFETLIYSQLKELPSDGRCLPTLLVVIDALDECDNDDHIRVILQQCSRFSEITTTQLKLFLTSRPELPIRLGFKKMPGHIHQDMVLHDVPRTVIEQDIFNYLAYSFAKIREDHNDSIDIGIGLDDTWPGDTIIKTLTDMAVPLFIAAATICRFVSDPSEAPQRQLQHFLKLQAVGGLSQIGQMYLPVLQQLPMTRSEPSQRDRLYGHFRQIVGAIVILKETLSVASLAALVAIPIDIVESTLRPLHSVLQIPTDSQRPVQILHVSFAEFMLSDSPSNYGLAIDSAVTHQMLLSRCLQILSGVDGLRQNICGLSSPAHPRKNIDSAIIQQCLPAELQYACKYWAHHVLGSDCPIVDGGEIHLFLQHHLLHWLEAMSLIEKLHMVVSILGDLLSVVPERSEISAFLKDAQRFILSNRHVSSLAPLQLYSSAIIFSPTGSLVRNICGQTPSWIQRSPTVSPEWGLELQKLEGQTRWINAVVFSPDSKLLASASADTAIRLWDASTGQEIRRFEGHIDFVNAVDFSPIDGKLLASASDDETVRIWDVSTGQEMLKLKGHTSEVNAVTFSPDGKLLASASNDKTVRLWEVSTGQEIRKLEGHIHSVSAVAFSPDDGRLLATASHDGTIRLWDASTGREAQKLEGHTSAITAAIVSPDGKLLASASGDRTVRLWSVTTGLEVQEEQRLEGSSGWIRAIAFSPDSKLLATASDHESCVRLRDADTGLELQKLEGHTGKISAVAFSPDGKLLVSASVDNSARLWDVSTVREVQQILDLAGDITMDENVTSGDDSQDLTLDIQNPDLNSALRASSTEWGQLAHDLVAKTGDWVQWQGQDLLWLPHEYSTSTTAVFVNVIVFQQSSGRVDFIRLNYTGKVT